MHAALGLALGWGLTAACGGAPKPAPSSQGIPAAAPPPVQIVDDAGVPPESVEIAGAQVRGLHGTLNHDDVVQTLEPRQPAFEACITASRRTLQRVSGHIEVTYKVDADGTPIHVRATRSDIGHEALELCLTDVLKQTRFPAPSGRARTHDLHFETGVDSPHGEAEWMDPEALEPLLEKARPELREACEARRRYRYAVTVYSNRRGRVRAAGGVVTRGGQEAREHLPCLLEQVRALRLPRSKARWNKVTFTL